jgi:hypothetical protein
VNERNIDLGCLHVLEKLIFIHNMHLLSCRFQNISSRYMFIHLPYSDEIGILFNS